MFWSLLQLTGFLTFDQLNQLTKKNMKKNLTNLFAFILLFSFSCKNPEEKKIQDDTSGIPFQPFKVLVIQHPVENFSVWKDAYEAHDSIRKAYGITSFQIGRGMEDSNMVTVIDKIEDIQKAKEFSSLNELKDAIHNAGVAGPPVFHYLDVIRNDNSKIEYFDRVMISHKVKNFADWLKVYDEEGTESRKANGLMDRGLARDIDDSNLVYIVFAITDMDKAKERMNSVALKKLMMDAGVEGPPTISFYRLEK